LDEKTSLLLSLLEQKGVELHRLFAKIAMREDDADDLLQELFIKLWKSGRIMDAKNPKAYLYQSAMNLAFDWGSRQQHEFNGVNLNEKAAPMSGSPEEDVIRREDLARVLNGMEKLSLSYRDLLGMRFLQEMSYEEMAPLWGSTPDRVRGRVPKAVERLRKLLGPDVER
jgi:RNA polymerase sigma-70 factor (ECF subfamily)